MGVQVIHTANPQWGRELPLDWLWVLVAFFVVVEGCIVIHMKPSKVEELKFLIVLGAQVQGRKATDSLVRRLDQAYTYLKEHKETKVIVSGGQGKGEELTEAEVMESFLIVRGIKRERIIKETKSTTTEQNLAYSAELLTDKSVPIGIVTNNFHMFRAVRMGKRAGLTRISRIPAGCSVIFFANYMVREFFAVIKMWIVR